MNAKPDGPPPSYGQAYNPPQQGQPPHQPYPVLAQPAPATAVVVNQPTLKVLHDYSFPHGKIPGGMMIAFAITNIFTYFAMGPQYPGAWSYSDGISAFIFYLIPGILGVVGAKNQTSSGVAIACIVMSCFGLILSVTQIVWRTIRLGTIGLPGYAGLGVGHLFLIIFALCAFGCCIALIVIPSQVTCCRRTPTTTTTATYPQNTPAVMYTVPQPQQTHYVVGY